MAFATVRVPPDAFVPWEILGLAIRIECDAFRPHLETLCSDLTALCDATVALRETLTDLVTKADQLLIDSLHRHQDTAPLWDDTYTLCGDPPCPGDCRVGQEGEYDGEDDYVEKYCRRGRR